MRLEHRALLEPLVVELQPKFTPPKRALMSREKPEQSSELERLNCALPR
jgi:hypothetical protein